MVKPLINFADFQALDIRIGEVAEAVKIADTDKLYQLQVNFGDHSRQIVSGIADRVSVEEIIGRKFPFLLNLEPRIIRGIESAGMILAAATDSEFSLLTPLTDIPVGAMIR